MQYVDCDRAEKHGSLCLGYGYEEIDEPCEQCQNCIKCECGYYQLGETEKDEQLTKAKEIIKKIEKIFYSGENAIKRLSEISDILAEAEQFLNSELQSKWINPARTTNDNEIKLNSEVEK